MDTELLCDQVQAPFFRLPRELRDEIYEQYSNGGPDGYRYDFASGKLLTASRGFQLSCKRVAAEMEGITLRTNAMRFPASAPATDRDDTVFRNLQSRAGRFHGLSSCIQLANRDMLIYAAKHINPGMTLLLGKEHPTFARIFGPRLQVALSNLDWNIMPWHRDQHCQAFDDAVKYCIHLALLQDPVGFTSAASRAFIAKDNEPGSMNQYDADEALRLRPLFKEGSFQAIMSWPLEPWSIPTDKELSSMERLLTNRVTQHDFDRLPTSFTLDRSGSIRDGLYDCCNRIRWYFSGSAIAADFLQRLNQRARKQVGRVIIMENRKAACHPESHLRGLIPFLCETSSLQIEVRVSLWSAMIPATWSFLGTTEQTENTIIHGDVWLRAMSAWVREIALLPMYGLPPNRLRVVFQETPPQGTSSVWPMFRTAAILQRAMLGCGRRQFVSNPDWCTDLSEPGINAQYRLPCHLPAAFERLFWDMSQKTPGALIGYDGDPGEPWDEEAELESRKHYSVEDWRTEWHRDVTQLSFATTAEFLSSLRTPYRILQPEDSTVAEHSTA